jgi:hypothetical protein
VSSVEPQDHADQQNASKKRIGEFIVACGNAAVLLQGIEEALDEIALAVESEIGLSRVLAVGLGRNDGCDRALLEFSDESV